MRTQLIAAHTLIPVKKVVCAGQAAFLTGAGIICITLQQESVMGARQRQRAVTNARPMEMLVMED